MGDKNNNFRWKMWKKLEKNYIYNGILFCLVIIIITNSINLLLFYNNTLLIGKKYIN